MESSKCDDGNFILYTLWFEVQMYFEHSELNNVNPKLVKPVEKSLIKLFPCTQHSNEETHHV